MFISLILLLSFGIFSINAIVDKSLPWHPESQVFIKVDGNEMTLQQALDDNILDGPSTYTHSYDTATILDQGHSANRIWVSVDGNEDTLLNLLSIENALCGSSETTQYVGSNIPDPVQFADEIEVSTGESLQEIIDSGTFCCDSIYLDSCNGDACTEAGTILCDGTCTVTKTAPINYGKSCGGSVCINAGAIDCDGICTGWSYKEEGTPCGDENICEKPESDHHDKIYNYYYIEYKKCLADQISLTCDTRGNCNAYKWSYTSWTECTTCGQEITRTATCTDFEGNVVEDGLCDGSPGTLSMTCNCDWVMTSYLGCGHSILTECFWYIQDYSDTCNEDALGETGDCREKNTCGDNMNKAYKYTYTCQFHRV